MADNRPTIGVEVVGNLGDQSNIVDLNLIAGGAISTGTATVRVTTNRIMGYTLAVEDSDAETGLVSERRDIIPAGTPLAGTSAWGFRVDESETWQYVANTTQTIKQTSTLTPETGDLTKVTFGVSVKSSQPEGTYTGGVIFTATANDGPVLPKPGDKSLDDIVYMQDMTPDICAKSVENETKWLIDERDGNQYYVAKLKDGNCWMTQNLALDLSTDITLTPKDTDVTSDYTPTRNMDTTVPAKITNLDSYAKVDLSWNLSNGGKWVYATPLDGTLCSEAPGGANKYDSVMAGGTLADLNCNNRYVDVSGSEWTADPNYGTGSGASFTVVDTANKIYNPHYLIGNYYSYSAATAKTGDNVVGSADGTSRAEGSICPRGWRLPTSGMTTGYWPNANGEFYKLLRAYGYPLNTASGTGAAGTNTWNLWNNISFTALANGKDPHAAPVYLLRAGAIVGNTGSLQSAGRQSDFYSSSVYNASEAFRFGANEYNIFPADYSTRTQGISIRCIAR